MFKQGIMKKLLILSCLFQLVSVANAQTLEEWFQQKKTQIKYLVQQIAALKVYTDYLQKGYKTASEGLNTITDIKNGDFLLHKGHFDSLKTVSPAVKESSWVTDIILLENRMVSLTQNELKNAKESGSFTPEEIAYLEVVFDNLISEATNNLNELILLTTDGDLQMKDDERIQRIDAVYVSVQDKYSFAKTFCKQTHVLAIQRAKEKSEVEIIRKLYGVK